MMQKKKPNSGGNVNNYASKVGVKVLRAGKLKIDNLPYRHLEASYTLLIILKNWELSRIKERPINAIIAPAPRVPRTAPGALRALS
jgi:hypothetical protein